MSDVITSSVTVTYGGAKLIDSVEMEAPVAVRYGNDTIASLTDGSATLLCDELVAAANISVGAKILQCAKHIMRDNVLVEAVRIYYPWATPAVTLSGGTLATPFVSGVTQYKIYDGNAYLGYFDVDGVWHRKEA